MLTYYQKLQELLTMKQTLIDLEVKGREMKIEQAREERLLCQKEYQFYLVDRLGLVVLMQKYCGFKAKHTKDESKAEIETLKKYF